MLRSERDYMLRMIAAAAAMVARLRERLAGGGVAADQVVQDARAAQEELLGRDAGLLRALDPASAAQLIADAAFVQAWADLMRVEADALRAAGRADDAAAVDARIQRLTSRG